MRARARSRRWIAGRDAEWVVTAYYPIPCTAKLWEPMYNALEWYLNLWMPPDGTFLLPTEHNLADAA